MNRGTRRESSLVAVVACLGALMGSMSATADVVAVVSAKSAVTSLSASEVAAIFLGKTTRFPDGRPAVPIDQPEGTDVRDEFYLKVVGKSAAQMKSHWSKIVFTGRGQLPKSASSGTEVKKLIAANPNTIGYMDAALVDNTVRVVILDGD